MGNALWNDNNDHGHGGRSARQVHRGKTLGQQGCSFLHTGVGGGTPLASSDSGDQAGARARVF